MKIGIITFQESWNCGALLQCFALCKYLNNQGHSVKVIDYRPLYNQEKYSVMPNPFLRAFIEAKKENGKKAAKKYFTVWIKTIAGYRKFFTRSRTNAAFNRFRSNYLVMTNIFCTLDELRANPPSCDMYIAGSDQIWNPYLTGNQVDKAYYCDFGDSKTRRVGYAISACQLRVKENREALEDLLGNFDFLSLREVEKRKDLEEIYKKNIEICIDPTLLLDPQNYDEIKSDKVIEKLPYILVYAFDFKEMRNLLFSVVERVSKATELPVKVILGPHKWPYNVNKTKYCGSVTPEEFLSYIRNAKYVVTNSFHATVFSLIYHKEFCSLTVPGRGARITELLSNLGMSGRIIKNQEDIEKVLADIDVKIDYDQVDTKLSALRKHSIDYLEKALKSKG